MFFEKITGDMRQSPKHSGTHPSKKDTAIIFVSFASDL
jgi:hypothetical protein